MWLVRAKVAACGWGIATGGGNSRKATKAQPIATTGRPTTTTAAAITMSRGRWRTRRSLAQPILRAAEVSTRYA